MISEQYEFLAKDSKKVAKELINIGCIQFNVDKPYTWVSGIKSPIYCDNRKINSYVDSRKEILNSFTKLIEDKFPSCDIIAGVATGGIPMGVMIADRLAKPFIYVRQEPKDHGLRKQVEGNFEVGDKVVLIEDHVSTGGSSIKAISGLRDVGLKVQSIISIVTYGFETSIKKFKEHSITSYSLTNLDVILEVAEEMGEITSRQKESIEKFKKDPTSWS